jgi:predicted GNAT family acetyltransferase
VLENQVACRLSEFEAADYTVLKRRQLERYRAMMDAGLGAWFGAFLDGRPVADLGVFIDGDVGRYQAVGTHPDYRRRGLCGTLVHHAAQHAFRTWGVKTLVMVANPEYHAARIYESVDFRPTERQVGLEHSR